MKKQFAVIAAIAFTSVSLVYAQDATTQEESAIPEDPDQQSLQPGQEIKEPSGAQPDFGVPAPSPTPPDIQPGPADPAAGASGLTTTETNDTTTVTVSQTFTNTENAITIVGKVNSEEEKQRVEQALSQALPDKEINNHLKVSPQQIAEPAGAERPGQESEREDLQDDLNDDLNENEPGVDSEREFELDGQNGTQTAP